MDADFDFFSLPRPKFTIVLCQGRWGSKRWGWGAKKVEQERVREWSGQVAIIGVIAKGGGGNREGGGK